uniref:EGF-like domain-containing protein n=1 Tax=Heterorhabditis bacteriophora TaxID=37862 RepID=A0A1I7XPX6_HETBA
MFDIRDLESVKDKIWSANQCSDSSLNSCDKNADCVQLPDGYTCKCFVGYVDVSSNANLAPGRVCTLSTACPVQATDLVFLIDGSGSIGSYIFQTEVRIGDLDKT